MLTAWGLAAGGCGSSPPKSTTDGSAVAAVTPQQARTLTPAIAFLQDHPLDLNKIVRRGDRILFVGDEMTQQRFYTRAVASALLAIMPSADLRFFNGGRDGATAASSADGIDDLLELAEPTVVFICLGLNDAQRRGDDTASAFAADLGALIDKVRPRVRQVVIVSPPAMDSGQTDPGDDLATNGPLHDLAIAARRTAAAHDAAFADVFVPMQRVYITAARVNAIQQAGQKLMLSLDGRLPNERGHVVMASAMLYGLGVRSEQLDPIGWSPLLPRRMAAIRGALGLTLRPPPLEAAMRSRRLYNSMLLFDQHFFAAWRVAPKSSVRGRRGELMQRAEAAWSNVRKLAAVYRQRGGAAPATTVDATGGE